MWTRCLGGFSVMWVTKLMISQVKKRIFCPKTTKFGPKLAFLVILGQAVLAHLVPCWWVGWWLWHAGCISQDTYLLYTNCCSGSLSANGCYERLVCRVGKLLFSIFFLQNCWVEHVFFKLSLWTFSSSDQANYRLSQKNFLKNSLIIGLKSALIKEVFEKNWDNTWQS